MSKYHVEDRNYPDFEKEVISLPTINDTDGMECPNCGGRMDWFDGNMDEEYTDGGFELTERFYCYDCGTFADVTQVYAPTVRKVVVKQDVFD